MSAKEDLPTDIILEILSRLPSKSIARFRCVSKLWASLLSLDSPNFTELFLTQSTTRPRLLLIIPKKHHDWCLYSCPQPQISNNNPESSVSVTAEFHMSLPKSLNFEMSPSISGLIYFPFIPFYMTPLLCNPSTRHFISLPNLRCLPNRELGNFLGYDPIDKQFIILDVSSSVSSRLNYQILKLGSRTLSSRLLDCSLNHSPLQINICINGILFYIAKFPNTIVSFDFNSEKFKFIDEPWPHEPNLLVNFKGKLGGIKTKWIDVGKKKYDLELSLWVLEDFEKQEWSEYKYNLPSRLWNTKCADYNILGVTGNGDIILSLRCTTNPFYVYFFNLEKKSFQKLEIKGFKELFEGHTFYGCVDYVEELRVLK